MAWVLDLDGVVWRGDVAIPGAATAVGRLRARGQRVLFVTNNSSATAAEYAQKLARVGIPVGEGEVVSSARAAATLVSPGETVLVCGGPGLVEAVAARGARCVRDGPAEVVVVGWHRDFDYDRLTAAYLAVAGGARFVATNDDATYPTPEGLVPGAGSIVASVAYATGVEPTIAGKPYAPMDDLVRSLLAGEGGTFVGDRPSTDGVLARRLGLRFALVLSGVTSEGDLPVEPAPDIVAADLAEVVAQ